MMDYTEWEEKAQTIFTEYLQKYAEFDPDYDINRIDPVLHFDEKIYRYGCCEYLKNEDYDFRIVIMHGALFLDHILRSTIVHELAHATAERDLHKSHGPKFKKQLDKICSEFNVTIQEKNAEYREFLLALESFDPDLYLRERAYWAERERRRLERKAARVAKKQVK